MSYVGEFLNLKCAGDVLNAVNPLGNKAAKEISESMAIIKKVRPVVLKEPMKYCIVDMCAGNALTSVLACFLLPIMGATAWDKRHRKRRWDTVRGFKYVEGNITDYVLLHNQKNPLIVISVHPCKDLAITVVELYNKWDCMKHLFMMPCCKAQLPKEFQMKGILAERLGTYEKFCVGLANMAGGVAVRDEKCLSPCNGIVIAHKNEG